MQNLFIYFTSHRFSSMGTGNCRVLGVWYHQPFPPKASHAPLASITSITALEIPCQFPNPPVGGSTAPWRIQANSSCIAELIHLSGKIESALTPVFSTESVLIKTVVIVMNLLEFTGQLFAKYFTYMFQLLWTPPLEEPSVISFVEEEAGLV